MEDPPLEAPIRRGVRWKLGLLTTLSLMLLTGLAFWAAISWGFGRGRRPGEDYSTMQVGWFLVALVVLTIAGTLIHGRIATLIGVLPVMIVGFWREFTGPSAGSQSDGLFLVGIALIAMGTIIGVLFLGTIVDIGRQYRNFRRHRARR